MAHTADSIGAGLSTDSRWIVWLVLLDAIFLIHSYITQTIDYMTQAQR